MLAHVQGDQGLHESRADDDYIPMRVIEGIHLLMVMALVSGNVGCKSW